MSDASPDLASKAAALASEHSLLTEFLQSAVYSAVAEPLESVAQLVDKAAGTHAENSLQASLKVVGIEQPAAAAFGTAAWHAQQIGGAIGMMLPYMLTRRCLSGVGSRLLRESAVGNSALDLGVSRTTFALAAREGTISAITGGVYGALFQPVDKQAGGSFAWQKLTNGLGDAATFDAMGFANPLLGSVLRAPVLSGIASGIPGGIVSAEVGAWKNGQRYASLSQLGESVYGMSFVGGAFGTAHWLEARRSGTGQAAPAPESGRTPAPKLTPGQDWTAQWQEMQDVAGQNGGAPDRFGTQQLVDRISELPPEQQSAAIQQLLDGKHWPKQLALQDLIMSQPEESRSALFGQIHAKAASSMTSISDLQSIISKLPASRQFAAITSALTQLGDAAKAPELQASSGEKSPRTQYTAQSADQIAEVLPLLSQQDAFRAVAIGDHALPTGAWNPPNLASLVPLAETARYIGELSALPDAGHQLSVLSGLSLRQLPGSWTADRRMQHLVDCLQAAAPSPSAIDSMVPMWKVVRNAAPQFESPIMGSLVSKVPPALLLHFMFGRQTSGDIEALSTCPELLRSLAQALPPGDPAARFGDPHFARESREIVQLYARYIESGSLADSIKPILAEGQDPLNSSSLTLNRALAVLSRQTTESDRHAATQAARPYFSSPVSGQAATALSLAIGVIDGENAPHAGEAQVRQPESDQRFLYSHLLSDRTGARRVLTLRQFEAWQSSGSIFPALRLAMESSGTGDDSSESRANDFTNAIFLHVARSKPGETLIGDYAAHLFSGDLTPTELHAALNMVASNLSASPFMDGDAAHSSGRAISPALEFDRDLVQTLLPGGRMMVKPAELAQAVSFARGWRDTRSLTDAWQHMTQSNPLASAVADEYFPAFVSRIAHSAPAEQLNEFVRFAGGRVLGDAPDAEVVALAQTAALVRWRAEKRGIANGTDAKAPEIVALNAVTPTHQYSQMTAGERQAVTNFLRQRRATNSLAEAWNAMTESRIWDEPHHDYIFQSIASIAKSASAQDRQRLIRRVAQPLLENAANEQEARNLLKQLKLLSDSRKTGADEPALVAIRALGGSSESGIKPRMAFAKAWLATHSLDQAWHAVPSETLTDERSARSSYSDFVSKLAISCPLAEQADFVAALEKSLLAGEDRQHIETTLEAINALARRNPALFSPTAPGWTERTIAADPAILQQLALDAANRNYSDATFARILAMAQSAQGGVGLLQVFDDAMATADATEGDYISTWIGLLGARSNYEQRRQLLQHLDQVIAAGSWQQSKLAINAAAEIHAIAPETEPADASNLGLLGDPAVTSALQEAVAVGHAEFAQRWIGALRQWQQDHSMANLITPLVSSSMSSYDRMEILKPLWLTFTADERAESVALMAQAANSTTVAVSDLREFILGAVRLGNGKLPANVIDTLVRKMEDVSNDFSWRMALCKELSSLQREGHIDAELSFPSLRRPPIEGVTEAQAAAARTHVEDMFRRFVHDPSFDGKELNGLLGRSGELGQIFPQIFGDFTSDGGIVGRPQEPGEDYDLDMHTVKAFQAARAVDGFNGLSSKEQVNLLWAMLLHDVGKRAGDKDPDHEWASGAYAWSVLQTLGYQPQRIQRIVDLISRHSEAGYDPETATTQFTNERQMDGFVASARYPTMPLQLRILNEADMRGRSPGETLLTPAVRQHLDRITSKIDQRREELSRHALPLLTSEVPRSFTFDYRPSNYVFLLHHTDSVPNFLDNLGSIESSDASLSATVTTATTQRFFHEGSSPYKIVLGAPWEHFSQSYRFDFGTGYGMDWRGHVDLMRLCLDEPFVRDFAKEADLKLRALGFGAEDRPLSALADARTQLSQFDTLDELLERTKPGDRLRLAHDTVVSMLTAMPDGRPLTRLNETKAADVAVQGLSVFRKPGDTLSFENPSDGVLDQLFKRAGKPDWVFGGAPLSADPIIVPRAFTDRLLHHQRPLVVLDWTRYDLTK